MASNLIFTVAGNSASAATPVTLAEIGLRERRDLQEWILAHPEILGPDLKIVTFEFDRWWGPSGTAPGDRLDVLGLGLDGRLVVAELKRDRAPDVVEMQAIKYAAMVSRFTPETLASHHARFLKQRHVAVSDDEAFQQLQAHAGDLDIEKLRTPRIVIVAGDFPQVLTSTAIWLKEMGLDITLVRVQAYRTTNDTIVSVSQFFPVATVEDFMITPRQAEVRAVEQKRERQKDATTTARLVAAGILPDGSALSLRPEGINEEMQAKIGAWLREDPRRALARWHNIASTPLIWEADQASYSLSGLAAWIVVQATGISRSLRGGSWWVTEDGRDLVDIAREFASPRERMYLEFWTRFAEQLVKHPALVLRSQPSGLSWLEMRSPLPSSFLAAAFIRENRIRAELTIDAGNAERNEKMLAKLHESRETIEVAVGASIEWIAPSSEHRYAQLATFNEGSITDEARYDEFIEWFIRMAERLREAVKDAP